MFRTGSSPKPEYTRHMATTLPAVPDLLDQLSLEQRQIQYLWAELERAHRHDRGERHPVGREGHLDQRRGVSGLTSQEDFADQILTAIVAHRQLKTDALYPLAVRVMDQGWVDNALLSDAELASLCGNLRDQSPREEAVFEAFTDAMALFRVHVEENERIVFPSMRVVLTVEDLRSPRHTPRFDPYVAPPEVIDLTVAADKAHEPMLDHDKERGHDPAKQESGAEAEALA